MAKDPKGRLSPGYARHVFICAHVRPDEHVRGCCSAKQSLEVMSDLKKMVRDAGLSDVRVQKSGCLDFCENGISCVVYPEAVWYSIKNPESDLKAILEHLRNGVPAQS